MNLVAATILSANAMVLPVDELPRRGTIGASFANVPADTAKTLGLKADEGMVVQEAVAGGTADKAGLRKGDVLLMLDSSAVRPGGIPALVRELKSNQPLKFTVLRDGKRMELTATLQERPRDPGNGNYDVTYSHIVSNGQRMRTIITTPKKPGKHPGFFFIQGFSPISYDFKLEGSTGNVQTLNGPLLYEFANSNYITIRVEKPGVGDSEGGNFAEMDYTTELDIYRQTLKQLKAHGAVDKDSIFIFGHSMGGAFGPMVAAENPVRGIITYGTASRTWFEYILDVMRYQPLVGGEKYENVDESSRQMARVLAQLFLERKSTEEVKKNLPQSAALIDAYFPGGKFNGKTLEFWRQLNDTNFPKYWVQANCHVFAVKGASDFVVYEADHKLIADAVNQAKPGYGKWAIAPGSDHLMHEFATEPDSMKNFQRGTFSLTFTKMMKDWIEEILKQPK